MNDNPEKLIIGLAGGIGCGKSTVARQFKKLGCAVIDADRINHQVLEKKEVISAIVAIWGRQLLNPDGGINRQTLGDIVFEDAASLRKLTAILHPLVLKRQQELVRTYQNDPAVKAIILDVPLLCEVGWQKYCDYIVFIKVDDEKRYQRLAHHKKISPEKAKKIENFQLALDKKAKISDYTIDNNSSIPNVAVQAAKILSLVLEKR